MRAVQTCENRCRDSRIIVGVGIDSVRPMWQNTVRVPAMFRKTGVFSLNDLAGIVKTSAPRQKAIRRGANHPSKERSNG